MLSRIACFDHRFETLINAKPAGPADMPEGITPALALIISHRLILPIVSEKRVFPSQAKIADTEFINNWLLCELLMYICTYSKISYVQQDRAGGFLRAVKGKYFIAAND